MACWGRCHAPIKSRRDIPDRRRATQRKPVRPKADSVNCESARRRSDPVLEAGRHHPNPNSKPVCERLRGRVRDARCGRHASVSPEARGAAAFQVEAVQPNQGAGLRVWLRAGSLRRPRRVAKRPPRGRVRGSGRGRRGWGPGRRAAAPPAGSPNGAGFPPAVGDGPRAGAEWLAGSHTEPRAAAPTQQPTAADSRALTAHTPTRETRTARAPPTPRPRHAPSHYSFLSRLTRLPSRRLDLFTPLGLPHPCLPDLPNPRPTLPPPRLRPPKLPAWAGPSRFYLDGRGRGSGA
jgi:hypothetical protein